MVSATKQFSILVEVDEINKQLLADCAGKAVGMPDMAVPYPGGRHTDVPSVHIPWALWGTMMNKCAMLQNYSWQKLFICELTLLHFTGECRVTGICLTEPLPSASRFLWAANNLSSFFSSSLKLLQYLKEKGFYFLQVGPPLN